MSATKIYELEKTIANAQSELSALIDEEKPNVIAQIKDLLCRYKINAADLGFVELSGVGNGIRKLPVKYRNPQNPDQCWCGRGTRPKWVNAYLANGGKLEDISIESSTDTSTESIGQLLDHPIHIQGMESSQ